MKVVFDNYRGDRLTGVLHAHEKVHFTEKKPGIVLVHGFAAGKNGGKMRPFIEMAEFLHEYGFNVLRFDMTGIGESGGDFSLSTPRTMAMDVRHAINYLKAVEYVDDTRIGVVGLSMGGLNSIMAWEQDVEAMVLMAPVLNPNQDIYQRYDAMGYLDDGRKDGSFEIKSVKVGMELMNRLRDLDAKPFIRLVKCPTLIMHGSWDKSVPAESSRKNLPEFGGKTDLKIIRGADHYFGGERTMKEVNKLVLNWFARYLIGYVPPKILRLPRRGKR
jgi:dipeptidyl aminopeptidase/acylaminoacyl peptidase